MHRSRQWIILTLLGLVGLGPIGSGELHAQTVQKVNITKVTNKEGKKAEKLGIDGGFLVDVTVQDYSQSMNTEVVVFLVALAKDSDGTVTDTLLVETGYDRDVQGNHLLEESSNALSKFNNEPAEAFMAGHPHIGEGADQFQIGGFIAPWAEGGTSALADSNTSVTKTHYRAQTSSSNPFAAYRKRGSLTTSDKFGTNDRPVPPTAITTSNAIWFGDADSLHVTGTGVDDSKIAAVDGSKHKNIGVDETYLFRWYAHGVYFLGEHDEVYAAAFVTDGASSNKKFSDIVLSATSMKIDGDRPVQGNGLHFSRKHPGNSGGSLWGFKDAPSDEGTIDNPTAGGLDEGDDGIWHPTERAQNEYHPVDHAGIEYAKEFKPEKPGELRIASGFSPISGVPASTETNYTDAIGPLLGPGRSSNDRIVLGIQDTLIAYLSLSEVHYSNIRTNDAADWDIVLKVGGQRSIADDRKYLEGPGGTVRTVLQHKDGIAENEYGDLSDGSLKLEAFIEDGAGNLAASKSVDGEKTAVAEVTTSILIDGIKPSLASRASGTGVSELKVGGKTLRPAIKQAEDKGDTVIFAPLGGDRLSGGGPDRDTDLPADENALIYIPNETLGELKITMKSKLADRPDAAVLQISDNLNFSYAGLKTDQKLSVDLSRLINAPPSEDSVANDTVEVWRDKDGRSAKEEYEAAGKFGVKRGTYKGSLLADGKADYVFDFEATDIAGNTGPKETRSGVTLDMKDIGFVNTFPIMPGNKDDMDVLGAASANVSVELNKPADTLAVIYKHLGPGSAVVAKNDTLTIGGDGLAANTFTELTTTKLEDGKKYYVRIDARDSAGNWTQAGPDTFTYDADHELAPAADFDVSIAEQTGVSDQFKLRGFKDDNKDDLDDDKKLMINAGKVVLITLQAKTKDDKTAFLYRKSATLTVMGGQGVDLVEKHSPGATQSEDDEKVITLDANGWGSDGKRTLAIRNTVSDAKLVFSFQGEGVTGAFELRDTLMVEDDAYAKLIVDGPKDPVTRGEDFTVAVSIADSFGNVREKDSRFVNVTADQIGAVVPSGDVPISGGTGSFIANSGRTGTFTTMKVTVRDIVQKNGSFIFGVSGPITVEGDPIDPGKPPVDPPVSIDAPDTLIAEDFMGALGEGDQGGFVILTFDTSDDHDIIDGYRIYREIMVSYVLGEDGGIVEAEDNTTRFVPWGYVDAVPDPDLMRVVVATLDTNTTSFQVAAEYVMPASKQAFMPGDLAANPYEVMARTMAESREIAAQPQAADGPLFATLSPEAVAFATKGVVPLMKSVENVYPSDRVLSNPVRAIDNIPPGAIPYLRVLDTPGDAGGSITVSWAKSPDDHMVSTSVGQAVGVKIYETAGVKGYNVYRKIGDEAYNLIGHAAGGATSYEDDMVFNGIRYTYQVRPYDADNVGDAIIEKTALAIRNRVFDADGKPVFGLFGTDNEVGFDDFFIFADQYGLTAKDETFEPAFDLNPDNKIDLYDFFAFADFFGRSIKGVGKTLPDFMAGLNSDARFYLDTGAELPRVGEEMIIAVSLQDFVELKGYGLSVSYDPELLSFVGTEVENGILGTGEFAEGQLVSNKDGLVSLAAYGDVGTEGDLGLNLVFRSLREIEDSYVEILDGELRDGNYGLNSLDSPVSVRIQTRPEVYALRNNFPNPFNPETTLKYDLPEAGDVTLEVYNMLGQVVRTLVNERQSAGRYAVQWDATNDRGQSMSSGIYFYRVQVGGEFTDVKKMLLLK